MYEARKICNFILANFDAKAHEITNLRINKLLFFIHAESLRHTPNGFVRNRFEAWQYGPVVRSVFDAFKKHGEAWISGPALFLDYSSGKTGPIPFGDIDASDADLIVREFEKYNRFTTGQLVSLSHEKGGPWEQVYQRHLKDRAASSDIPNTMIRQHYFGPRLSTGTH